MNAENFVIDNCSEGKVVEDFCAVAPNVDRAVLSETFVVESVHLSDLTGLMVASDQCDAFGVSHFKGKEEQESLN